MTLHSAYYDPSRDEDHEFDSMLATPDSIDIPAMNMYLNHSGAPILHYNYYKPGEEDLAEMHLLEPSDIAATYYTQDFVWTPQDLNQINGMACNSFGQYEHIILDQSHGNHSGSQRMDHQDLVYGPDVSAGLHITGNTIPNSLPEYSAPDYSPQLELPMTPPKASRLPARTRQSRPGSTADATIYHKKPEKAKRNQVAASFRACWRCKKYRKPCDSNEVCNGCFMTSGFRVWPSTLGCRRGNMHEFAYLIVPLAGVESLKELKVGYTKPFSWRIPPVSPEARSITDGEQIDSDIWDSLIRLIRSTHIHGPGIIELLEICARYQRRQSKENATLRDAAISLKLVVELYLDLISISAPEAFDTTLDMEKKFVNVRKALMITMDRYLHTCLTGRLKAWPSTILSCSLFVLTYVYLADAVAALPWFVRTDTWVDVKAMVLDLRNRLYLMTHELLSALAKGVRILDMECWRIEEDSRDSGNAGSASNKNKTRNGQGMKMMDDDESAFDTMLDLVQWRARFLDLLNGDIWLATKPFQVAWAPVMSLARMFSVAPVDQSNWERTSTEADSL